MGGTDTQVDNPSQRLHQTEATITGHVTNNCFCLGFVLILEYVAMLSWLCLDSRVIQQVVDFCCVKVHHVTCCRDIWY